MNSYLQKLNIKESIFEGNISLSVNKLERLNLINSFFQEFSIILSSFNKKNDTYFQGWLEWLDIVNSSFTKKFFIHDSLIPEEKKIPIKALNMFFGENMKGEIRIDNILLNMLWLENNNYESEVTFDETKIDEVYINNFSNYRTLSFFKLQPISTKNINQLTINKSNLGKTQFHYCDLAAYKSNIEIDQTSLVDIIPTGVNWFTYKDLKKSIVLGTL